MNPEISVMNQSFLKHAVRNLGVAESDIWKFTTDNEIVCCKLYNWRKIYFPISNVKE